MQFMMDMEELVEEVRKVITENHLKGSRKGHKKSRKDAIEDGIKKMSQIEFDTKLTELEERINLFTEMLQDDVEGQYSEWNLEEEEDVDEEFVDKLMKWSKSSY